MRQSRQFRLRVFNTYEPVNGFYRDLLPELARSNISSEVVLSQCAYREGNRRLEEVLTVSHLRVHRIPSGVRYANTRAKKVWVLLIYWLGGAVRGISGPGVAANLFLTQPPLFLTWGPVLRALRRQRYFCLIMDLYPHVLAANQSLDRTGIVYRLLCRLMIGTLARADRVVVIGRCMRDRLIEEGVEQKNMVVIPNWTDGQRVYPVARERNPLCQKYKIDSQFVVLYSGNMGIAHQFDTILSVAERLRCRDDIRFLFLGTGPRYSQVKSVVRERRLDNVTIGGGVAESELAYAQSLGSVHFISLRDEYTGLMVPSKSYTALAAGRPLLYEGDAKGEIARLIREEKVGRVVPSGDADELCAAIEDMACDKRLCEEYGVRARNLATERQSLMSGVEQYVAVVSELVFEE